MSIPISEQETIIQFSRSSDVANIWTTDTTVMTKLDKRVNSDDSPWGLKEVGRINGEIVNKEYFCPKDMISFRSKKTIVTEDRKKSLCERMKNLNSNNN